MPLCAYGCGQLGIKYFTCTKRWCCNDNVNRCPAKRERDAAQKRGKNPFEGREHPRGMLGKKSWNSGQVTPVEVRKKISFTLSHSPNVTGVASTLEGERLRRQRISRTAKLNGKMGGYRPGSGVGKKTWYTSPIAGHVHLQSTYELRVAQLLDSMKMIWQRNTERFPFTWNEKSTYYIPDFVVMHANQRIFLKTKGFVTEKDKAKWNAFPHKLRVLMLQDIERLERLEKLGKPTRLATGPASKPGEGNPLEFDSLAFRKVV